MPHILLATDADWVRDEVVAALGATDTSFDVVRAGKDVVKAIRQRTPDLAVLDLQIGNMGGMATAMELRLEESAGRLPHVPVLMLLDRSADVFLARRSSAEGWVIKPLDAFRLRKAARAVLAGQTYTEGVPTEPAVPAEAAGPEAAAAGDDPVPAAG